MRNFKIFRNPELCPLTWRMRDDCQPMWLKEYQSKNGYIGLRKALKSMSCNEIIKLVIDSGLKGRGGAGFLTGIKWHMMSSTSNKNKIRYLLCNADEMEPGTYKDRLLMERLPHLLIEGMLIAGYALQANCGYIFLRYEYVEVSYYLLHAIQEAIEYGFLGKNILDSSFNFEIYLHTGAGRYICGEETALINSLEGKRPIPRIKPPFPATIGLWGQPTCVNNVETLCNLPAIIQYGISWYKNLSVKGSQDTGTKLMGFSGRVKNPGIWELPFGISAREIFEDYAGGMRSGLSLKAWQPGGASTAFFTVDHLDINMDFNSISEAGSRMGTGMAMAVDNRINMVSLVRNLEKFFSRESCGWCTPCREGLPWVVKVLFALENKIGCKEDIKILEEMCCTLSLGKTFCAHAPGAMEPLRSALQYFMEEFEDGVTDSFVSNIYEISGIKSNFF